jgi:hypothetical protein
MGGRREQARARKETARESGEKREKTARQPPVLAAPFSLPSHDCRYIATLTPATFARPMNSSRTPVLYVGECESENNVQPRKAPPRSILKYTGARTTTQASFAAIVPRLRAG